MNDRQRRVTPGANASSRNLTVALVFAAAITACTGGGPAASTASVATSTAALPSATAAGSTAVPSTPAPPTPTPTAAAPSIGPVDLEALVPTEVGGIALISESVAADDFLQAYETFQELLAALERSVADVSIVQSQGANQQTGEVVIVQAFRVAGADPESLLDGFVDFWLESEAEGSVAEPTTIAGKELIVLGSPTTDAQYKAYYYGYGDVVFRLGYNGDKFDEQMAELVSQLP